MSEPTGKARILVVDDEPVTLELVQLLLQDDYQVLAGASNGKDGLKRALAELPDLVLTDIAMPDMSGYDLCRELKESPASACIPVIFLSGVVGLEEHLAGHDAGGEDFLSKPFTPAELQHAVSLALRLAEERQRLATDANSAFRTAMTAMSSAAEIGVVLNFVRNSFSSASYAQLADAMISACNEFGLNGCVQLRGRDGQVSRNRNGDSSSLEDSILARMSNFGRIVDFSQRTAVSYEHATLMITDMPRGDDERYGRLRDHLAVLCECADARVQALDAALDVITKNRALIGLMDTTRQALADIERRHAKNHNDTRMILHDMLVTVEQSFATLGLTDDQENYFTRLIHQGVDAVMELFAQGLDIDHHLNTVTAQLKSAEERLH
jgi:DNA-binding response OmpR family regulator